MKQHFIFLVLILTIFTISCENFGNVEEVSQQSNIPNGAITKNQEIPKPNPPNGWLAVICWLQAATLQPDQYNDTAKIEIDYMNLIEYNNSTGLSTTIENVNYDTVATPRMLYASEGGLWMRKPSWYCCNDSHTVMYNSLISNGFLSINLAQYPNNIAHWWTSRHLLKSNCKYYLEVRVRVIGKCAIQMGSDWWISMTASWCGTNICNTEAWASDWFGDTGGDFNVIKVPMNW